MLIPHGILGFAIVCGQDPVYEQWAIPGPCIEYPRLKIFKIVIQGTHNTKHPRLVQGDTLLTHLPVFSIIIDVWFTFLPWKIVWNLKLKNTERLGFAFAMSLGAG